MGCGGGFHRGCLGLDGQGCLKLDRGSDRWEVWMSRLVGWGDRVVWDVWEQGIYSHVE